MRPPILWISVAFGAGLWTGLDAFQVRGAWYVVAPVLVGAAALHRRAPLGAALGIMAAASGARRWRSEEHTSELQSRLHLVCRLLLEKKKKKKTKRTNNLTSKESTEPV